MREVIDSWNEKAETWKEFMGARGDNNRFFNSDPVLWRLLGNPNGKTVLDAGCGTGYLSVILAEKGAIVVGVDISPGMIDQANKHASENGKSIRFLAESCTELPSVKNESIDLLVSNYVLMDLPDLDGAMKSFFRVLRPGGSAVLVFSHPCFDALDDHEMYFDEIKKTDKWGPFKSEFIYFHRPLSQYCQSFRKVGFRIESIEEPVAQDPFVEGFKQEWRTTYRKRPWSIAFLLSK